MFGLAVDGVSGLLLYPLLLNRLGPEPAGLWMIMLSMAALMNLAQASMAPTVTGDIARSIGNPTRLSEQIKSARTIAGFITAGMLIIGLLLYFLYMESLFKKAELGAIGASSWIFFSVGIASFSYAQLRMFVLNGLGQVGIDKVIRAVCVILGFGATWFSVQLTGDFRALAISYCAQNLLFMFVSSFVFRVQVGKILGKNSFAWGRLDYNLIRGGARILVLNSSSYVLSNFAIFLAERHQGLDFVPKYTAMTRIGMLLSAVALLIPQMAFPYVARAWSEQNLQKVRRYYAAGVIGSVAAFLCAAAVILLAADWLFPAWLGDANYLGKGYLAALLFYFLIYVNHVGQSTPVLAIGAADFLLCAIFNAITVALMMLLTANWLGIWSYPVSLIFGTLPFSIYVTSVAVKNILLRQKGQHEKQ